jgi:hypothetical protein
MIQTDQDQVDQADLFVHSPVHNTEGSFSKNFSSVVLLHRAAHGAFKQALAAICCGESRPPRRQANNEYKTLCGNPHWQPGGDPQLVLVCSLGQQNAIFTQLRVYESVPVAPLY